MLTIEIDVEFTGGGRAGRAGGSGANPAQPHLLCVNVGVFGLHVVEHSCHACRPTLVVHLETVRRCSVQRVLKVVGRCKGMHTGLLRGMSDTTHQLQGFQKLSHGILLGKWWGKFKSNHQIYKSSVGCDM